MLSSPPLVVGQHAPEAAQGFGGDARTKLGNVPFQIGTYEILPPAQAARFIGREQAVRKPAAQPEIVGRQGGRFQHAERRQFKIGDASGQAFAGLFEQVEGCGPQQ
ncbi:MAG: hypothetical protein H6988_13700 [Pseudomonadales bacterium]|nr:hypothetical protein [Pseudomonadales bacterium]